MKRIKVTYEIVTPMFLGGANQKLAELRLPSIKGALRSWYRVFMPAFNHSVGDEKGVTHEEALFGGARSGAGQSRFLMRMTGKKPVTENYRHEVFDSDKLKYFTFFLKDRSNIPPGQTFSLEVILRTAKDEDESKYWKAIVSCLWLLGHAGGMGARKNRGFGALALREWETNSQALEYMNDLPIAYQATTIEEWIEQFGLGIKVISQWFPGSKLLDRATIYYYAERVFPDWKSALATGAELIKTFRKNNQEDRMAFGMPLKLPKVTYKLKDYDRMASPILLSVVLLRNRYVPIFFLCSADFPPVVEEEGDVERDYPISIPKVISHFGQFLSMKEFKEAKWGE
ncbi:hypothetical protein ADL26_07310 [Thermoactinomyces vulgaris]|nr:hypothetical protein ADL26_07310 [Thermoactinomyces vulgaris]